MPSPFPGMDPFLEHPDFFPDLHASLITYMREAVQQRLPPGYFAAIGQRVWVDVEQREIEPDVHIRRTRRTGNGGVAVAEPGGVRKVVIEVPHDERRETFIEIRRSRTQVVTTIEILSSNKTPERQGRELYLRKQREILDSQTHLIEIDLLRSGQHTTAVPLDELMARCRPLHYHVCVHRYDRFEQYVVYPVELRERLPTIDVPLLPEHSEIRLDLQAVFDRAYDAAAYDREADYDSEPVPPLDAETTAWMRERIGAWRKPATTK
jgi:hypothetical protein